MPNKNAKHIKQLKSLALSAGNYGMVNAVNAAIHALKIEGRSPWRKVGKHPGKKWEQLPVLAALSGGMVTSTLMPTITGLDSGWRVGHEHVTHWMLWPKHPEKEVK